MLEKYSNWIHEYAKTRSFDVRYQCQFASKEMVKAFPELRLVRGYTSSLVSDDSGPHWWCEIDDQIIDPTASQFKRGVLLEYEEHDDEKHGPIPRGKCMNCGGFSYTPEYGGMCSIDCETSFAASF